MYSLLIASHSASLRLNTANTTHNHGMKVSCRHERYREMNCSKSCDTLVSAVKPTIEVSGLPLTKPIEHCFRSASQTALQTSLIKEVDIDHNDSVR